MSMNNLTKVLVCLISQKSLRRPCEQIARVALLAVALIASLSGCARGSVIDMIDHQYNVELVDRLILDDDRDAYLRDEPKSLAFLNDTTLSVATEKGSVLFVDVSDPTDLAHIGRFDPGGLPNEAQHVFIVTMDGFAYVSFVARRSDRAEDIGLMVVDARQPAAPELAFELPIEEVYGAVMAAQDNYLYIRNVVGTIEIWDATDPFSLSLAGAYSPPQSRLLPRSKDKEPGFTLPTPRQLAAEKGIGSFMAHKDPELVASQSCTSAGIRGVAVENGFLYLLVNQGGGSTTVCEDGGLWIIDVSSPEEPMPVAFLPASEFGVNFRHGYHDVLTVEIQPALYGLLAAQGYVYLTTELGTTNMAIVDVSEPARPVVFGWGNAPDTASTRAVEDGLAYVLEVNYHANWLMGVGANENLQIFDVTEPAKPVRIGIITRDKETGERIDTVRDVAVRGAYIFLAESQYVGDESGRTKKETKVVVLRLIDRDAPPWELQFSAPGN